MEDTPVDQAEDFTAAADTALGAEQTVIVPDASPTGMAELAWSLDSERDLDVVPQRSLRLLLRWCLLIIAVLITAAAAVWLGTVFYYEKASPASSAGQGLTPSTVKPTLSPTISPPPSSNANAPLPTRIDDPRGGFSYIIPAGWVESDATQLDYGSALLRKQIGVAPPGQPPPVASDTRIILGKLDQTLYASAEADNSKAATRLASDMGEFLMPYQGTRINQETSPLTADGMSGSACYYEVKFDDATKPNGQIWAGVIGSTNQRWFVVWLGGVNDPVDKAAATTLAQSVRPLAPPVPKPPPSHHEVPPPPSPTAPPAPAANVNPRTIALYRSLLARDGLVDNESDESLAVHVESDCRDAANGNLQRDINATRRIESPDLPPDSAVIGINDAIQAFCPQYASQDTP